MIKNNPLSSVYRGLPAEIAEHDLFEILYKLDIIKRPIPYADLAALQAALNASMQNFGKPSTLIVDPRTFDSLKNISYNPKKKRRK